MEVFKSLISKKIHLRNIQIVIMTPQSQDTTTSESQELDKGGKTLEQVKSEGMKVWLDGKHSLKH